MTIKPILGIFILLGCTGCGPIITRPVTIGRVIDCYSGLGLKGAVVTVHEFQSQSGSLFRPPQSIESSSSDLENEGRCSLLQIMSGDRVSFSSGCG
ncbi:MAG TPA: hypothetical protein VFW23_09555 [Tepidisphaeraceae bacterium]|nr:hypothetical protein [Tepidisphaeraceae bacterium]